MIPRLPIAWPRCFSQAIYQQHFGADRFKAVSAIGRCLLKDWHDEHNTASAWRKEKRQGVRTQEYGG